MPWFSVGERFVNIHHAIMRIGCSRTCGFGSEDPYSISSYSYASCMLR